VASGEGCKEGIGLVAHHRLSVLCSPGPHPELPQREWELLPGKGSSCVSGAWWHAVLRLEAPTAAQSGSYD